ncbi:hypothetical protein CLAIMM_08040 [Cladophialophora immunda]|nr:hypothetical protein CLAIMM_08040 [Cladophialophora immunda]
MNDFVDTVKSCRRDRYLLPFEILAQIISNVVPRDGLCVSNHPDYHSDFATIGSLLRVSVAVQNELLHRIFSLPLQVRISSGISCRCLFGVEGFSKTRLGRAAVLPLGRFPEIVVTFVPRLLMVPCGYRSQTPFSVDFLSGHRGVLKFRTDIRCISRQSQDLAEALSRHPDTKADRTPPFRFRFDGTHGMDEVNRLREIPLWEVSVLRRLLEKWQWVCLPTVSHHTPGYQIDVPEKVVTGVVLISKYNQDDNLTGISLDDCPDVVARYWKGLLLSFYTDSSPIIMEIGYNKNRINRRFIITARKATEVHGAEDLYEAECFIQDTDPH